MQLTTVLLCAALLPCAAVKIQAFKPTRFSVKVSSCYCDLRKLECLPSAACMEDQKLHNEQRISLGEGVRSMLKSQVKWEGYQDLFVPLGKSLQYGTISAWRTWVETNTLPSQFAPGSMEDQDLLDWKKYPYCKENSLKGGACLFGAFNSANSTGKERSARSQSKVKGSYLLEHYEKADDALITKTYQELDAFREHALDAKATLPADKYLLSFGYLLNEQFNLNPSMLQVYKDHLAERNPGKGDLKVALHVRRADSCSSADYRDSPSPIDSRAQTTNVRQCYNNSVYMDGLRRIKELYKRPLTIYLSSDDSTNLLKEFKEHHHDIYTTSTWRYIDYDRDLYKYEDTIEGGGNHNKAFMDETAIQDLHHMGHAEAFVGHLGSRFGKIGYILATARQNSPLPYISVDGHNICCEIDEQCERGTAAMHNMVDCLTFAHEQSPVPINDDYWEVGSTVRERVKQM